MCNINIIYKKDRKNSPLLSDIMNVMSFNSWQSNNHGEGYFALQKNHKFEFVKSLEKIRYDFESYFLASHQRLATSGKHDEGNTHPHVGKYFAMMHNGIFFGLGGKKNSDSNHYLRLLETAYEKDLDIISALNQVHKKVNGSYSIVLFEKSTGKMYYYKNTSTHMTAIFNDNWLIMSTRAENTKYGEWYLNEKFEEKTIENNTVYNILNSFEEIGKFAEKQIVVSYNANQKFFQYDFADYGNQNKKRDYWDWGLGI